MSEQVPEESSIALERGLELAQKIASANAYLYNFAPDDFMPSATRNDILPELDGLWDTDDTHCLVSGTAKVTRGSEVSTVRMDAVEGYFDGFRVTRFGTEPKGSWRVGLGFNVGKDNTQSPRKSNHVIDLQNSLEGSYGLLSLTKFERDFPKTPTLRELLTMASDMLVARQADPEFFDLEAGQQETVIEEARRELEDECAGHGYTFRDTRLSMETDKGYALVYEGRLAEYRRFDLHALKLSGICRGVKSLAKHQLERGQAIQTPEELIDASAGLCLLFEPDESSLQTIITHTDKHLSHDTWMLIPISGQEVDASFAGDTSDSVQNYDQ